jgi:hypothetical protein
MKLTALAIGAASLLSGSAFAADAIVAAEPEPIEYVRVCDAYGTGYFYIPGTETCLHIGGYLRFDVGFGFGDALDSNSNEDWGARTRAKVWIDAKSDTEWGPLWSRIVLEGNNRPSDVDFRGVSGGNSTDLGSPIVGVRIDQAFLELAGFRAGKFVSWWDDDFSGETDAMANVTNTNALRYQYESGDFFAGFALEELGGTGTSFGGPFTTGADVYGNSLGYDAAVGGKFGQVSWSVYGGYDGGNEEGAITARIGADLGPGKAELAVLWSSGLGTGANGGNAYYNLGEWAVVAQYAFKATDKFTITPAFQYNQNITTDADGGWDDGRMWRVGVTLDYQVVKDLNAKLAATYVSEDYGDRTLDGQDGNDWFEGLFRLQRDF